MSDPVPGQTSMVGLLLVVFRTFVGYLLLFSFAVLMLRRAPWQLGGMDVAYWLVLAVLVALRLREASSTGVRTGLAAWLLQHLGLAAGVWVLCNCVQFLP